MDVSFYLKLIVGHPRASYFVGSYSNLIVIISFLGNRVCSTRVSSGSILFSGIVTS